MAVEAIPDGRLGLLVGVTGHRKIEPSALDAVTVSVRRLMEALKADFASDMPIAVLSSLAAGADQLVASVALDLGMRVIAVLPHGPERLEVGDASARATIDAILRDPSTSILDLSAFSELERDLRAAARSQSPETIAQLHYELAGMVIARHAHLYLALVHPADLRAAADIGRPAADASAPVGGVQRVIHFWLDGRLTEGAIGATPLTRPDPILRPFPTGPLIHIATPRAGVAWNEAVAPGHVATQLPGPNKPDLFIGRLRALLGHAGRTRALLVESGPASERASTVRADTPSIVSRLRHFNDRRQDGHRQFRLSFAKSRGDLLDDDALAALPGGFGGEATRDRDAVVRYSRELFARADGLANIHQQHVGWVLFWVLFTVPVSVLAFEVFAEFVTHWWMLVIYVVPFALMLLWHGVSRNSERQDRYQDCRLLGEAARVQFFWGLAGMPRSVADEHRCNELGDGSWLHAAVKWIAIHGLLVAQRCDARDFVTAHWLGTSVETGETSSPAFSYLSWYRASRTRNERLYGWFGAARILLFGISYGLALFGALLVFKFGPGLLEHLLVVAIPTIAAAAGVMGLWRERRTYEQHVHEYQRMTLLVDEALRLLGATSNADAQESYLHAIGQAALGEASHWLAAHRSQPVEPMPSAG